MYPQKGNAPYKRPLLAAGFTAVVITAVALRFAWWLSLLCALAFVGWLCFRRMALCVAVAILLFVSAMGYRHWYVMPTVGLDGVEDTITGVVVEQPAYGDMYTLRIVRSDVLRTGTRVMLLCNGEDTPRIDGTVTATVALFAVKDNQNYYISHGAFVCAFPRGEEDTAIRVLEMGRSPTSDVRVQTLRALTAAPRRYLDEEAGSILSALCFGDRTFLSAETTAAFRGSGLSHLLVVSGLHLSMVVLAVRQLLRRTGARLTCLLTIVAAWLFAWLVGFSPSVVRAAVMCTLWLVGLLLFCRSDGLNALGLAAVLLLTGSPYTLYNVGFQLSFAATLGVLLLAPRLVPRYDEPRDIPPWYRFWWRLRYRTLQGAAVCASALLFTLPIAAYHYGGLPIASVVSNLLALPVAGAILLLGWVGSLCGLFPLLGWLSKGILFVTHFLVRYLQWVAEICSPDWGWVTISQLWQWLLLLGLCAAVICALFSRISSRRVVAGVMTLAVLAVGVGIPLTVAPVSLTVVPSDNEGGFILRQGTHCALLVTHAGELDEVTYETAPFIPDAVVVGYTPAAELTQWDYFPTAQVVSAADVPVGTVVELWRDCRLAICADGWWHLQIGGESLWIATDPEALPPDPDGACIYVGGTPTRPPRSNYTVVCSRSWIRRRHPDLTGRETFVLENPITLIPKRGEWRMSLWL